MAEAPPEMALLLCTDDQNLIGNVPSFLAAGFSVARCSTLKDVQSEIGAQVVGVIIDAALPMDETFAMYRFLRQETRIPFLILLPPVTADQPAWVMDVQHGEQEDYARQPISVPELILRLHALLLRNGKISPDGITLMASGSSNGPVSLSSGGYGKVICVYGAHGGVGKTTIAVHLAVGLTRFADARVALIDGDLWMGDIVVYLNLTATRTILDATANGIPNDPEVWTRVVVDHSSGVKVLAPPAHLEDVERVPEGAVAAAALGLRRYFDFVVVDLDDLPSEVTMNVLDVADQVLVVLTPELNVVRNTLRLLTIGRDIGLKDRARLVLNRSASGSGLDTKQVQSMLPNEIIGNIASDGRLFVSALNLGVTIFDIESAKSSAARRDLEALVHSVADFGRPQTQTVKRGLLSGLTRIGRHS